MLVDQLLAKRIRGLGRLRALLRGGHPTTLVRVRSCDGLTFALDPESYLDWFVISNGYYEREVLNAIVSHLPQGGVFWDIGANFGLHAVTVRHLRPDAKVTAFEPVPFTASRLLTNCKLNGMSDIEIVPIAIGNSAGYARIHVKLTGNSGLSSLAPWENTTYDGSILCRVESGDDLVRCGAVPTPSVIKIDVEGFEPAVVEGLTEILHSDVLQCVLFESDGQHYQSISELLGRAGFSIRPLRPDNVGESSHVAPNHIAVRNV